MTLKQSIGEKIRQARERRGYSQSQLGELMRCGQGKISKMEEGTCLTIDSLELLSKILDIPLKNFFEK